MIINWSMYLVKIQKQIFLYRYFFKNQYILFKHFLIFNLFFSFITVLYTRGGQVHTLRGQCHIIIVDLPNWQHSHHSYGRTQVNFCYFSKMILLINVENNFKLCEIVEDLQQDLESFVGTFFIGITFN